MMRLVNVLSRFRIAPVKALWVAVYVLSRYEVVSFIVLSFIVLSFIVLSFSPPNRFHTDRGGLSLSLNQKRSLYNIKFIVRIGLSEPVRIGNKR
jgi:hypothetical protein